MTPKLFSNDWAGNDAERSNLVLLVTICFVCNFSALSSQRCQQSISHPTFLLFQQKLFLLVDLFDDLLFRLRVTLRISVDRSSVLRCLTVPQREQVFFLRSLVCVSMSDIMPDSQSGLGLKEFREKQTSRPIDLSLQELCKLRLANNVVHVWESRTSWWEWTPVASLVKGTITDVGDEEEEDWDDSSKAGEDFGEIQNVEELEEVICEQKKTNVFGHDGMWNMWTEFVHSQVPQGLRSFLLDDEFFEGLWCRDCSCFRANCRNSFFGDGRIVCCLCEEEGFEHFANKFRRKW